jgi:5,10-methylenetetrahydromethanopterin reductase
MEFGATVFSHPGVAAEQTKFFEQQGFTHAWFADVPMCAGDVYTCMALAAAATRTITLGTYIAIAPMRAAPVTVQSIATVNALAPGRVILGFGSGSFTRGLMGLPPMRFREFREQVRVIRGLLDHGEALAESEGMRRKIRFYGREFGCINLDARIPLYVAASAPKAAALAGELGDGVITTGLPNPEPITLLLQHVAAAARNAGREVGRLPCVLEGPICVLRPGETLESARVIEATGAWVMVCLKFCAAGQVRAGDLPAAIRPVYEAFLAHTGRITAPAEERHLAFWEGVFALPPEERRFVTPDAIRTMTLSGTLEEVVERVTTLERVGVTQFNVHFPVWPPASGFDEYLEGVRAIIGRL